MVTEASIKPLSEWALARFTAAYIKAAGVTTEELAIEIEGITGSAVQKFIAQKGTARMRDVFARWATDLGYPDNPSSAIVAEAASAALEREIEYVPVAPPPARTVRVERSKPRPPLTERFLDKASELGFDIPAEDKPEPAAAAAVDPLSVPYSDADRGWLDNLREMEATIANDAPAPVSDTPRWPPVGFTAVTPLPRVGPAGQLSLYIKDDRAFLNAALARAMDQPAAIRVAIDAAGEQLAIQITEPTADDAIRVGKKQNVEAAQLPVFASMRRGIYTVTQLADHWLAQWSRSHAGA